MSKLYVTKKDRENERKTLQKYIDKETQRFKLLPKTCDQDAKIFTNGKYTELVETKTRKYGMISPYLIDKAKIDSLIRNAIKDGVKGTFIVNFPDCTKRVDVLAHNWSNLPDATVQNKTRPDAPDPAYPIPDEWFEELWKN